MRFLDDVIERNQYPIPQIDAMTGEMVAATFTPQSPCVTLLTIGTDGRVNRSTQLPMPGVSMSAPDAMRSPTSRSCARSARAARSKASALKRFDSDNSR